MGQLGWSLIQYDWCPYKRRLEHKHAKRKVMWRHWKKPPASQGRVSRNNTTNNLFSDFQPIENKCLLFKLPWPVLFVSAALANKLTLCIAQTHYVSKVLWFIINIYFSFISASWEICMQVRKHQLELDMEQQTGSK